MTTMHVMKWDKEFVEDIEDETLITLMKERVNGDLIWYKVHKRPYEWTVLAISA